MTAAGRIDWSMWTVILLKPDCLVRGLVEEILGRIGEEVAVVDRSWVTPTEQQVFAHYDDMVVPAVSVELGLDVPAELRRIFVGRQVVVALGYGPDAATRVRAMVGATDPAAADRNSLRGRYGRDSLVLARSRGAGQLVNNLVHTSDRPDVVERDFGIWYGADQEHLLHHPRTTSTGGAS